MWSLAPESITHILEETFSETLGTQEEEEIPENTNEHVPAEEDFSRDPSSLFNLSISSLSNPELEFCDPSSLLE